MRKLISILSFLLIAISVNAQWYGLNPKPTTSSLRAVCFVSPGTGWIGGTSGTIMKTTNGGSLWIGQSISSTSTVYDIEFFSENMGILCTGDGKIFKTSDGGSNWMEKYSGGFTLLNLQVYNSTTAYAVGGPAIGTGRLLKSGDGGDTWNSITLASVNQIKAVHFFNSSYGIVGTVDGKIRKTLNGGTNWNQTYSNQTGTIYKFFYLTNNIGYASVANNTVIKTTAGDTLWSQQIVNGLPSYTSMNSLHFNSSFIGWVVCDGGYIANTQNGGVNWVLQSTGTTDNLYDITFVNGTLGFAVGNSGIVLSTSPFIGITKISEIVSDFNLDQNYPNPFNPVTKIKFKIAQRFLPSTRDGNDKVVLKVFDILGKEVATLVNEKLQPGIYEVKFIGSNLGSGVYFYKLTSGSFIETKKMLLVR